MTARLLAVAFFASACALGAHLTALLVFAVTALAAVIHVLPVLATVAIGGTVLFLLWRICATVWLTGGGCRPIGRTA